MDWLQLLLQIPLVAAFMWFVLERDKRDREEREARETREQTAREKRDDEWRKFLIEQRLATVEALADVSRELQHVASRLHDLQDAEVEHHEKMHGAIERFKLVGEP